MEIQKVRHYIYFIVLEPVLNLKKKEMSSGADDDGDGERQEPVVPVL